MQRLIDLLLYALVLASVALIAWSTHELGDMLASPI